MSPEDAKSSLVINLVKFLTSDHQPIDLPLRVHRRRHIAISIPNESRNYKKTLQLLILVRFTVDRTLLTSVAFSCWAAYSGQVESNLSLTRPNLYRAFTQVVQSLHPQPPLPYTHGWKPCTCLLSLHPCVRALYFLLPWHSWVQTLYVKMRGDLKAFLGSLSEKLLFRRVWRTWTSGIWWRRVFLRKNPC